MFNRTHHPSWIVASQSVESSACRKQKGQPLKTRCTEVAHPDHSNASRIFFKEVSKCYKSGPKWHNTCRTPMWCTTRRHNMAAKWCHRTTSADLQAARVPRGALLKIELNTKSGPKVLLFRKGESGEAKYGVGVGRLGGRERFICNGKRNKQT